MYSKGDYMYIILKRNISTQIYIVYIFNYTTTVQRHPSTGTVSPHQKRHKQRVHSSVEQDRLAGGRNETRLHTRLMITYL